MGSVVPCGSALERLERGERVIVRTGRGLELGEVLGRARTLATSTARAHVIERRATPDDLNTAERAADSSPAWQARCQVIFGEGLWPIEVVDIEPLLEPGRAVVYYFGPQPLDTAGLQETVRDRFGLDLLFEPVALEAAPDPSSSCGSGGCGSCGAGEADRGCGTALGCSGCAVAKSTPPVATGRVTGA